MIKERSEEIQVMKLIDEYEVNDLQLCLALCNYYESCLIGISAVNSIAIFDSIGPVLLMPMRYNKNYISYFGRPSYPIFTSRVNKAK